ncbi:hypothetical protein QJ48_13535 [Paenibacillus sp. A3]|nr:hypothetical protein [Paenibacillus sp. A3]KPV58970.1 hypothetical protein QJ48_13535 [Paenibacillus sp. A3]
MTILPPDRRGKIAFCQLFQRSAETVAVEILRLQRLSEELGIVHVLIKRFDPIERLSEDEQIDDQRLDHFAEGHFRSRGAYFHTRIDVFDDM